MYKSYKWYYWNLINYIRSVKEDFKGVLCGHCHKLNLFYDDCGWFWFKRDLEGIHKYGCRECYEKACLNNCASRGDR